MSSRRNPGRKRQISPRAPLMTRRYPKRWPDWLNESTPVADDPPTGGTITEIDGWRIHTFTSNGTFDPVDYPDLVCEYLVVGGGGGGSAGHASTSYGCGGGGGTVRRGAMKIPSSQAITVGVGGGYTLQNVNPTSNGTASSIGALVSASGGNAQATSSTRVGGSNADFTGGTGPGANGGGGGAGAGGPGSGLVGGVPVYDDIDGTTRAYGGGGQGTGDGGANGTPGDGGSANGVAALANQGGGGCHYTQGGAAGRVVIRYRWDGEAIPDPPAVNLTGNAMRDMIDRLAPGFYYMMDESSYQLVNRGAYGPGAGNKNNLYDPNATGTVPALNQASICDGQNGGSVEIFEQAANTGYLRTVSTSPDGPFPAGLGASPAVTIGFWIQTTDSSGGTILTTRSSSSFQGVYSVDLTAAGLVNINGFGTGATNFSVTATLPITDGLPHFVMCTMDAGAWAPVNIYIDGMLAKVGFRTADGFTPSTGPLIFGRNERDNAGSLAMRISHAFFLFGFAHRHNAERIYEAGMSGENQDASFEDYGTLAAWYDFGDTMLARPTPNGTTLDRLIDKSTHSRDVAQSTAASKPTYNQTNNSRRVAGFDGSNDDLRRSPFEFALGACTIFFVMSPQAATANTLTSECSNGGAWPLSYWQQNQSTQMLSGEYYNNGGSKFLDHPTHYQNTIIGEYGVARRIDTTTAMRYAWNGNLGPNVAYTRGTFTPNIFSIGRRLRSTPENPANMRVAEILIYVGALSESVCQQIEADLYVKHAITRPTEEDVGELATAIKALNPKGYWKLNERVVTNAVAVDHSSNGRVGVVSGATLAAVVGEDGHSYPSFDGTNDYVEVADNSDWSPGTASGLTIFALVKPASLTGNDTIMGKHATSNYEWAAYLSQANAGDLAAHLVTAPGNPILLNQTTTERVVTTDWQAVAFVLPTTSATDIKIYRNSGTPAAVGRTTAAGSISNGTAPVRIGYRADNVQPFHGNIGHAAIFAGQLSDSQIQGLMDAAQADGWF